MQRLLLFIYIYKHELISAEFFEKCQCVIVYLSRPPSKPLPRPADSFFFKEHRLHTNVAERLKQLALGWRRGDRNYRFPCA